MAFLGDFERTAFFPAVSVSHTNLQNMKFANEEGAHLLLRPTLEEDSLEIVPQVEESVVPSDV